ncbi:MAG: hypothetical protein KBC73_06265 [Burkholderiaceae bacterium]|nr:hypothetical protein [Burkholderiaceae bacterium]
MSQLPPSDGTSQAQRHWPELDPAHALIDERGPLDWLAFVRAYARELVHVDAAPLAPANAQGDWSGLLPEAGGRGDPLDDALRWLQAPLSLPPERAAPFQRPHVALLLAFTQLLELSRDGLNQLPARHLQHWLAEVLKLTPRPARPDRVHVIAELEDRVPRLLLPAGTWLAAGTDALGRPRRYCSLADLVASPVRVAQLRSLRADIVLTGVRQALLQYRDAGSRPQAFVAALRVALGQPAPGDALPAPIHAGLQASAGAAGSARRATEIDFDALMQALVPLRFIASGFAMPLVDDWRRLMRLRRQRLQRDRADWATVNAVLAQVAQARGAATPFKPQRDEAFDDNLRQALGLEPAAFARLYDGLPEVKSADQAWRVLATRRDVQAFVQNTLRLSLADFDRMMQAKLRSDVDWADIQALIEQAARRQKGQVDYSLSPALRAQRNVDLLLDQALGLRSLPVAGGLDGFQAVVEGIERWFALPAETVEALLSVAQRMPPPDAPDWLRVADWLEQAHRESRLQRRRLALRSVGEAAFRNAGSPGGAAAAAGAWAAAVNALLPAVLGLELPAAEALDRLQALGLRGDELDLVQRLQQGRAREAELEPASVAFEALWQRLVTVLEVAQRNRENLVIAAPVQRRWRWLHAADDARSVRAQAPAAQLGDAPTELPRWRPFGAVPPARRDAPPAPRIGWALASPLLVLAEGQRSVQLLLGCDGDAAAFDADALRRLLAPAEAQPGLATQLPWRLEFSGAKGWIGASRVTLDWNEGATPFGGYVLPAGVDQAPLRQLRLSAELDARQPALVPPELAVHGLVAEAPVLRLMLAPVWDDGADAWTSAYALLRRLRLRRLKLAVAVSGLGNLLLRNDQGVLDSRQPFEPFGHQPAAGARLQIGHAELVSKPLDSISLRYAWMAPPASLDAHYANYPGPPRTASFSARLGLREGRLFSPGPQSLPLFSGGSTTADMQQRLERPPEPGRPAPPRPGLDDVGDWSRCLVWELDGDFQHALYPTLALQKSLELAAAIAKRDPPPVASAYQVNAPYTPKLKRLSLDYSASSEGPVSADAPWLRLLHVHPFGAHALGADELQAGCPLLPEHEAEGELFIALAGVQPPQRLSLLLQLAEGSADPDVPPPPTLRWSVLSADRWLPLSTGAAEAGSAAGSSAGGLLADGTRGLINAGIVELALPAVAPSSRMPQADPGRPGGLLWLRLQAGSGCAGVCDVVDLHPNALLAQFVDQDNAPAHLARPLPPAQISGPSQALAGLARLKQPYASFGGRMAEDEALFRVRVAERVRHRQRALTPWDHERLVLAQFPQLHQVRCLRADDYPAALRPPPGTVTLVVVPAIAHRHPFEPDAPRLPADQIRDIQAFMADKLPPGARLRVLNPRLVTLRVRCGVRLRPGSDEALARAQLTEALNRFLSPWAYDDGAELLIGGRLYASHILHFIEQQTMVDYLAELRLFTSDDGGAHYTPVPLPARRRDGSGEGYAASAGRPDAVLVAARSHEFVVIGEADYRDEGLGGIGHMRLEFDFIVA